MNKLQRLRFTDSKSADSALLRSVDCQSSSSTSDLQLTIMKKRICIIGAGVAGLCCLRHLTTARNLQKFDVVAFEEKSEIGGIWVYTSDARGTRPNPMYRDMKTNLPKEVMCYPDFPYKASQDSFLHHSAVLEYLQEYAAHFGLEKFVQFRKSVQLVHPIVTSDSSSIKWEVTVQDLDNGDQRVDFFDYVMVCNGHFSKAHLPVVPNLTAFSGRVLHSQAYRYAEEYAGQSVLIVGSMFSAIDIALEIAAATSTEVVLSVRRPDTLAKMQLPGNVRQVGPIEHANEAGFVCRALQQAQEQSAGTSTEEFVTVEADAIIFCTGYEYTFPFLSPACETRVASDGKFVSPLYKELIHAWFPSLCLVGLQQRIVPFIMVDVQVRYYLAYMEGRFQIPPITDPAPASVDSNCSNTTTISDSHILGARQWQYHEDLAAEAGLELDFGGADVRAVARPLYPCVFGSFVVPDRTLSLRERNELIIRMNDAIGSRRETLPALFKEDRFQVRLRDNFELDFTFIKHEPEK